MNLAMQGDWESRKTERQKSKVIRQAVVYEAHTQAQD